MTISNPSFEIPASVIVQPGFAADWDTTTHGTLEERAEFEGDVSIAYTGIESFEHGWSDDDPQTIAHLVLSGVENSESFEIEWDNESHNQGFFYLSSAEQGVFAGGLAFDAFEQQWSDTDADNVFVLGEVANAAIESFADWGEFVYTLGEVAVGYFEVSSLGGESQFEGFGPSAWSDFLLDAV